VAALSPKLKRMAAPRDGIMNAVAMKKKRVNVTLSARRCTHTCQSGRGASFAPFGPALEITPRQA